MIEQRREGLERFLQIVAGHPLLQVRFSCALPSTDADPRHGNRLARKCSARSSRIRAGTRTTTEPPASPRHPSPSFFAPLAAGRPPCRYSRLPPACPAVLFSAHLHFSSSLPSARGRRLRPFVRWSEGESDSSRGSRGLSQVVRDLPPDQPTETHRSPVEQGRECL